MKRFSRLPILIAVAISAAGQPHAADQRLIKKKCGVRHVSLPLDKYGKDFPSLFGQIRVIDARPDTSRIGIVHVGAGQRELLLDQAPSVQLREYLNAAYSRPAGWISLLIVLKNLWISTPDSSQPALYRECDIRFRVEAYVVGKDGYQPLTRMDSTIITGGRGLAPGTVGKDELRELFDVFMHRLAAADFVRQRPSVSYRQIDSFNRRRFAYPMDTATLFPKGVYANAADFWNNSPSMLRYRIDKDASGNLELSLPDEAGRLIFNHTVWGYCDGSRRYVMLDGYLFPIFNVGHQFYALGSKFEVDYSPDYILPAAPPFYENYGVSASGPRTIRPLRIF